MDLPTLLRAAALVASPVCRLAFLHEVILVLPLGEKPRGCMHCTIQAWPVRTALATTHQVIRKTPTYCSGTMQVGEESNKTRF